MLNCCCNKNNVKIEIFCPATSSSSLAAPVLDPLSLLPGSTNNYVVSWNSVLSASSYALEVSSDSMFNNPSIVFQGNALSLAVNNQPSGTYWYRVFASNSLNNSPFSNVQSIVIP